jgi:hypothetical protein
MIASVVSKERRACLTRGVVVRRLPLAARAAMDGAAGPGG